MNEAYEAAVLFAHQRLSPRMKGRKFNTHTVEPSEALYRFSLRITEEFPDGFPVYIFRPGTIEFLAIMATRDQDRGAYDLLCRILASRLIRKEPIPKAIRQFISMTLVGLNPAPKRTKLAQTFGVNLFFLDLLNKVHQISGIADCRVPKIHREALAFLGAKADLHDVAEGIVQIGPIR